MSATDAALLSADLAWPLWDEGQPLEGAFQLDKPDGTIDTGVVTSVQRPWLFGYRPAAPAVKPNGRGILILGGGGYTQLMVGREGLAVARWLTGLGFHAFVLVHRFPNCSTSGGAQAPLDDARRALHVMAQSGLLASHDEQSPSSIGICGLSSGGHLGAALLAEYPSAWTETSGGGSSSKIHSSGEVVLVTPPPPPPPPRAAFAIVGYGPISTNAKGRTIIPNKPALEPPEKQLLYDTVQPDVQISGTAPPTFIVYSGNDPVVPVVNAYRLAEGISASGASVELHVFADAPHGFALDTSEQVPVSRWPALCEAWLRQKGFL